MPVPSRVAALDHKAGDDPVENRPVIEAPALPGDKVIDGLGAISGVQLGDDLAAVFHFNGHNRIAINIDSFLSWRSI